MSWALRGHCAPLPESDGTQLPHKHFRPCVGRLKTLMRLGDAAASPAPLRGIACVDPACKLKAGLYTPAINLQAPAENLSLKAVGEIHDVVREFQRFLGRFRWISLRRKNTPLAAQLPADFFCQRVCIQGLFVFHQLSQALDQKGIHGERLFPALFMQPCPDLPVCLAVEVEAEKQRAFRFSCPHCVSDCSEPAAHNLLPWRIYRRCTVPVCRFRPRSV